MRLSRAVIVRVILAGASAMLAVPGTAHAVTLLATGLSVHEAAALTPACFAANIGTTAVRVNSMKLIAFDGSQQAVSSGNCSFPGNISPGLTCEIDGATGFAYVRCVIEVATSAGAKNIRGTLLLYNEMSKIRETLDAR